MKRCIIFTGGRPEPHLPDGLELEGAYIIAADSGYKNCKQLGAVPNLAVGDYDSLNFVPDDCEHITYPCEKDDTDLMAAVREALRRGCGDITILGAMGGRFDHTFANVQVLAFINSEGARGRILSCGEEIMLAGAGEYSCLLYTSDAADAARGLFAFGFRIHAAGARTDAEGREVLA